MASSDVRALENWLSQQIIGQSNLVQRLIIALLADGHLLLLTQKGQLQIAKVSPDGFDPITTADLLSGRCWTVPVLHNGRLYVRNLERIACYNLRG